MSADDPLKRALVLHGRRDVVATARPEQARIDEVLARVRKALPQSHSEVPPTRPASPSTPPHAQAAQSQPAAAPGPATVQLPMTCAATGKHFVVLAERRGGVLYPFASERAADNVRPREVSHLSGSYRFEVTPDWRCPVCGDRSRVWWCQCVELRDALHCGGTADGRRGYCACGQLEERNFVTVDRSPVRGKAQAATALVKR
jgi:hypothetical protein